MGQIQPNIAHMRYRPDIDGLRALAVLFVVLFHAGTPGFDGGFIGVDVFFVISGYLISSLILNDLQQGKFSLVDFYGRRIRRIFPALVTVMVAAAAFGWIALFPDEYAKLGKHLAAGSAFVSNFLLWGESGYFDDAADTKPLLHLWSLGIEEQFYIVWPLTLALLWARRWSFLHITASIAAVSFAVSLYLSSSYPVAAFFSPVARFWELMLGGLLAYLSLNNPSLIGRHRNQQALMGAVLLSSGLLAINRGSTFPGWWALLPTLGTLL